MEGPGDVTSIGISSLRSTYESRHTACSSAMDVCPRASPAELWRGACPGGVEASGFYEARCRPSQRWGCHTTSRMSNEQQIASSIEVCL